MKYLLPSQNRFRICVSMAQRNVWHVDGHIVIDGDETPVIKDIFESRILYRDVSNVGEAAARMEALKDFRKEDRYSRDELLSGCKNGNAREIIRSVADGVVRSVPKRLVDDLNDALDTIAGKLGLIHHYRI